MDRKSFDEHPIEAFLCLKGPTRKRDRLFTRAHSDRTRRTWLYTERGWV